MTTEPPQPALFARGQPLHTRTLAIDVFQDEPGRLRAEGEILDLRKVGVVPTGGDLQTAGFIHHMQIHLWLELEAGLIEKLEAFQPHVPFEAAEATGHESCRDVVPRLQPLVGQSIEDAFHRNLSGCFGGPLGCSHLLTLAQGMGAALPAVLARERDLAPERGPNERVAKRAIFLDGFGAEDGAMNIAIQLSDFATTPKARVRTGFDRLALQSELQVDAGIDLGDMTISSLEAVERTRSYETLSEAAWENRSTDLEPFVGGPALSGMAAKLFEQFGGRTDRRLLLDAMLQFAPGLIQCFAARTEELLQHITRPDRGTVGAGEAPRILSVGGTAGSCHMWRADGVMIQQRTSFDET
jgi:hypothetical protein